MNKISQFLKEKFNPNKTASKSVEFTQHSVDSLATDSAYLNIFLTYNSESIYKAVKSVRGRKSKN